jgi:hypothetical protein
MTTAFNDTTSYSTCTEYLRNIYGDGKTKKYHLDHLKLYSSRTSGVHLDSFPQHDSYADDDEPGPTTVAAQTTTTKVRWRWGRMRSIGNLNTRI